MIRAVATIDPRDIFARYGPTVNGGRRWMRRSCDHVQALG